MFHHIMGGVRINKESRSSLTGLFACGEVAGGIHGANRLSGNAMIETQVFGAIAGRNGLAYTRRKTRKGLLPHLVRDALVPLKKFLESRGTTRPIAVERMIQEVMWLCTSPSRTDETLRAGRGKNN